MPSEILRSAVFMGLLGVAIAFNTDYDRLAKIINAHNHATILRASDTERDRLQLVARCFVASYLGAIAALDGALYIIWTTRTTP